MIWEVLLETAKRVLQIIAVILPVLFLVEYLNHRYGKKLIDFFENRQKFLPFWAALLAMLPGCNAAAAVAVLYAKRLVSLGAVVAAMIATSDEAIYVFIPQKFNFLPLFVVKFLLAIIAGFTIDAVVKYRAQKGIGKPQIGYCCSIHEHHHGIPGMIWHVLEHGAKIVFFIFVVLFTFNFAKDYYGFESLSTIIAASGPYQPLMAALFGLIPGCGTSVALASLYSNGLLNFGAAVAGLSAASGDTLIVLLSNKLPKKEVWDILGLVLFFSLLAGYLIYLIS